MKLRIGALLVMLAVSLPAAADPFSANHTDEVHWYRGEAGRKRILHLAITTTIGLAYGASELFKSDLAASSCRWCTPPAIDRAFRNALVWDNTGRANTLSDIDVYILAPTVGFGLLLAADYDAGWARFIDDTLPVAESVVVGQTIAQIVKFSVGRARPYVVFQKPTPAPTADDNVSFMSGHSAFGMSITASAGLICHWRGYWVEPYVWAAGLTLSLSAEYLRMAADEHYLTDVVAGGLVGLASGLLVPRLMRSNIKLIPSTDGVAVAGTF